MECRAIFQMNKATSTHQVLLWNFRECHIHTDMDRRLYIPYSCSRKKENAH
jgi:hypothetical protein